MMATSHLIHIRGLVFAICRPTLFYEFLSPFPLCRGHSPRLYALGTTKVVPPRARLSVIEGV